MQKEELHKELEALREENARLRSEISQLQHEKTTHHLLQSALETIPLGVTISNQEGEILYTNPAEAAMHGFDVDELVGQNVRSLAPPTQWRNLSDEEVRNLKNWKRESLNVRRDGSVFPVNLISTTVKDDVGNILGIVKTCEDISEKKDAEERLLLLKSAIETIDLGVTISDKDGKIFYTNPAEAQIHGYDLDELLGREARAFAPQKLWRPMSVNQIRNLINWKRESINIRRDGTEFPVSLISNTVQNKSGDFIGVVTICEDIEEKKKTEENLLLLKSAVDTIGLGITITDRDGKIVFTNPAEAHIHGYTIEELVGQEARQLAPQKLWQKMSPDEIKSLTNWQRESVNLHKNGTYFPVQLISTSVRHDDGDFVGIVTICEDITEKKRTREAMQLLNSAMETIPLGVTISDPNGVILSTNPAEAEMHGYEVEELIGQEVRIFSPPQYWKRLTPEEVRNMKKWKRESRNQRRDGSEFPVQLISTSVKNTRGDVLGIVTTCEDITERKEAEVALRRSQERYALAVQAGRVGIWDWDLRTNEMHIDPFLKKLVGYEPHELDDTFEAWLNVIHPQDVAMIKNALDQCMQGEKPSLSIEHRLVHRDGSIRWIMTNGRLVRDDQQQPIRMVGTDADITDITLIRQAEEALAAEKERLAVTLRSIGEGVITTDVMGQITLMNSAAEMLTGWNQAMAKGRQLSDIFNILLEETREPIPNPAQNILANHQTFDSPYQITLVDKSGGEKAILVNGAPIQDQQGTSIGVVIVFRDVSEIRRAEQAKTRFINAISHELRTPLTPIIGYAEMMLTMDISTEERQPLLQQIIASVKREKKLVDELIALAQLESDLIHYALREIEVLPLFMEWGSVFEHQVKEWVWNRYGHRSFVFNCEFDSGLEGVKIRGHSHRIQRIVAALLDNAVKYSALDRIWIELTARMESEQVLVSVRDQGYGISQEWWEDIFKPFFQIRRHDMDVSDGLGLGLTLARRFVEGHGGEFMVDSEPDQGSCFSFTIPILNREGASAGKGQRSILLVEDDATTMRFLELLLERHHFDLSFAFSGEEGLARLQQVDALGFDVVVLDLNLPDVSGEEILVFLSEHMPEIPVILCSAQPRERLAGLMDTFGNIAGFVVKPFLHEILLQQIELALKK